MWEGLQSFVEFESLIVMKLDSFDIGLDWNCLHEFVSLRSKKRSIVFGDILFFLGNCVLPILFELKRVRKKEGGILTGAMI